MIVSKEKNMQTLEDFLFKVFLISLLPSLPVSVNLKPNARIDCAATSAAACLLSGLQGVV